jgi:hypothetical protein
MKKSMKGEVVLSTFQIQATRLNKLEYHRLQRNVSLLQGDLETHIARLKRQEQGLKIHFTNVVRVVKPNRAYQLWKQAHAQEIAQDEANELIGLILFLFLNIKLYLFLESIKLKEKFKIKTRQQIITPTNEVPSQPLRPLLLLLGEEKKKPLDSIFNINENFLRPKTSPINRQVPTQHRINPILNMLHGRPFSSNNGSRQQQPQQPYDSPSFYSSSSMGTTGARKLVQGKFVTTHKEQDLDALYRMALQNQTAYKSIEQKVIDDRKLHDKEFASQHRALKGSMRSVGIVN